MSVPSTLTNEQEAIRLQSLLDLELLDTDPEPEFDELVHLASIICGAPISLMTLVDSHRQWFKASQGMDVNETSREIAFCAHAIARPEVFVVENASEDDRFSHNPLVTGYPNIRFYAGMPIEAAEGQRVGTLCVIDTVPRHLTELQIEALRVLGHQVSARMQLRMRQRQLEQALREKDRIAGELQASKLELEEANAQLKLLTLTDPLTGLRNRRSFEERLLEAFAVAHRTNSPLTVVMLDIDHFKLVNDMYGHAEGDLVLREVGTVLQRSVRVSDMAARYGGEEFVVILQATSAARAMAWTKRVEDGLARMNWPHGTITLSMGIAQLSTDIEHPLQLVKCADEALYQAKREGRARAVIYCPQITSGN